jgi:hypothetical protein
MKRKILLPTTAIGMLLIGAFLWKKKPPGYLRAERSYTESVTLYHYTFYFLDGDSKIEGPSVIGGMLSLSYPDLNKDGYRDIKVVSRTDTAPVAEILVNPNFPHKFSVRSVNQLSLHFPTEDYFGSP